MKFFTCCSNKIENLAVEPQKLPEKTDHSQTIPSQNIQDSNSSSQSLNVEVSLLQEPMITEQELKI